MHPAKRGHPVGPLTEGNNSASGQRKVYQLIRGRVSALYTRFEGEPDAVWFDGERWDPATGPGEPVDLGRCIVAEFARRGVTRIRGSLQWTARRLAGWALRHDPSLAVAARFAVDYALDDVARRALLADDAANLYTGGLPRSVALHLDPCTTAIGTPPALLVGCRTAFEKTDLHGLRALIGATKRDLEAATRRVLQAAWEPRVRTALYACDPVRPPMESLALIAREIEVAQLRASPSCDTEASRLHGAPQVLAVGLGISAGPQALSAMLPAASVYADPVPYHAAPIRPRCWDAAVLNLPTATAVEVAAALAGSELPMSAWSALRARSRRRLDPSADHVAGLVERLVVHRRPGARVYVLADPQLHHIAAAALTAAGLAAEDIDAGVSAAGGGTVYVGRGVASGGGQGAPPRASRTERGLPPPSGRVVSAWRWP